VSLIFASNEETESGLTYDDRTGVSYEFPKMYQRLILPGTRFIYYRGRRRVGGGRQDQVYFGVGLVGTVGESAASPGRLSCEVLDYIPFLDPVPFRSADGSYLEPDGTRKGFFQRGVRSIGDKEFERILALGVGESSIPPGDQSDPGRNGGAYGSRETALAVDRYAMSVAEDVLRRLFMQHEIVAQPHNNPGFDVRVGTEGEVVRYVEVKGTQLIRPLFFLTEGERRFSLDNSDKYSLIVVSHIDLDGGTHETWIHHGSLEQDAFELRPVQWRGRFPVPAPAEQSNNENIH
jgi:hypothetical protein